MPQSEMHLITDLETKALSFPDQARQLVINSPVDYVQCGEFVKAVDALGKEVDASFSPQIAQAHALHRSLIAEMNRHLTPLQTAKTIARGLMIGWDRLQEMKRREEEARLQDLARKVEEDAQLVAALAAEAAGLEDEAEAILKEEIYVPPIIVKKDVPKVNGVRFQTVWRWRIKDLSKIPREYFLLDEVKIGAVVRGLKWAGEVIPGIESYSEKQ